MCWQCIICSLADVGFQGIVAEVDKLKDTYDSMCQEGLRWTGYLVHSDFLLNFASDSLSDEGNPYCSSCLNSNLDSLIMPLKCMLHQVS